MSKKMKIYARQIPPEFQESPLFWEDAAIEGVEIFGNSRYNRRTSALFDRLPDILEELAAVWDNMTNGFYENVDWAGELAEIAPPVGREAYTREERKNAWPALLNDWNGPRQRTLCRALELITGRAWDSCTLRGCCPSDWQDCVFRVDLWNGEALERLEAEYFNTGTEWVIHNGNAAPDSPEDIDGEPVYCVAWNDTGIKKEIAAAVGGSPENVILYKFDGWIRAVKYEEV